MVEANSTYISPYPQQWLFSPAHLEVTPSSEDNTIPLETELEDRRRGVDLIRRICERLPELDPSQVPEVKAMQHSWSPADARHWDCTHAEYQSMPYASYVQYAAATFLHRFYMRFALQDFPIKLIAPTCLYLALKTEEMTKIKVRTISQAMKVELGYERAESRTYTADLVINEEYLLEALCYDLAVEHPQAILIQGHRAFQQVRRKSTARNIVNSNNNNSTPIGSNEGNQTPASFLSSTPGQGGKTPGSTLGGRTPGSNLGNKTPGSALGSVIDMDMDSPLPRHANFIGDKPNGGGGQREDGELDGDAKLSEEEAEEVLLDLATEILMAT
ncbi:hypothetical protein FFLO_06111 [Filobasidium floriforme]|uniref:Cyclin N-terminal domain-containing protein n=1 Tax=Filobasidium floriforme TaxID=5210 RepID=A0A8K0JG06_9TREE|nr:cyclin-like protein [Filobasidium floriforme]KAG7528488.1 hypothetical protein FFLO_06111 [Filobasidium floriforme]KAH8077779.1 cyclin-like protein [Filobasidium floriforme]